MTWQKLTLDRLIPYMQFQFSYINNEKYNS